MGLAQEVSDPDLVDALESSDTAWTIHRSNLLSGGRVKSVYRYWPDDEAADHVEIAFTCHDNGVSAELQADHVFMSTSELDVGRLRDFLRENGLPQFPDVEEVVAKIRKEFSAVTFV